MDVLNCKICEVPYDEEDHRPRNSPCGHEICSTCVRALIKDGIFECPKCRKKNIVNTPKDLPVCFGLIDVIRAFKFRRISFSKENEPRTSGVTNYDLCKVHHKPIRHRCLKCQIWLCEECSDFHPSVTGCSTISASNAVCNIKEKQTKTVELVLAGFKDDVRYVSFKIKDNNDKFQELDNERKEKSERTEKQIKDIMEEAEKQRKAILEKAEKQRKDILEIDENQKKKFLEKTKIHQQEVEQLNNMLEQSNLHQEKLLQTKKHLEITNSPYALMDTIEVLTQRMQILNSYSAKNLGADSLVTVIKELIEEKDAYVTMEIKDGKRHGKLSLYEGNICIQNFQTQSVPVGIICMPYARLKEMIPESHLVFLEMSIRGAVKGKVLVQLKKNLPNIRENMVNIVTGQLGKSLAGIQLNWRGNNAIGKTSLPFSDIPVTPDGNVTRAAKRGDVVGTYDGYLYQIFFHVDSYNWDSSRKVLGSIISGQDIIQECSDNHGHCVTITDCGLVLQQE